MEIDVVKFLMDGGLIAVLLFACYKLWTAYQESINARIADLKEDDNESA